MGPVIVQWLLRIFGYGLSAGAAIIGSKYGAEAGTAAGVVGGFLLNKATQNVVPKKTTLFPPEKK